MKLKMIKIRLQRDGLRPVTLLKESSGGVFSVEFSKISKNTFLTEHLWATAFEQ